MTKQSRKVAVILGVVLALVPFLMFTYIGLQNRLLTDDYVYLGLARDIGAWNAMLVWRELWNGGYSSFLLYGLLAPLGASAPPLFSLFLCASIFIGFGWLTNTLLANLQIHVYRRAASVALAALATAAVINGFYIATVFYYQTRAVVYSWPAAMMLLGIAMAAARAHRLRGRVQHLLAALAAAIYAFICAGFAELYLVFQLVTLALIAIFALVFQHGPKRNSFVILAIAGSLGTVASLFVQLSAPGFANRSSLTDYFGLPVFPIRDLPNLVSRTLDLTLEYLAHQTSFAGFMLLAFAALFVALTACQRSPVDLKPWKVSSALAPIVSALIVQVLFVPILWTHRSDSLQLFGRFSYAFALVVCLNLLAIMVLLALLWRRTLLNKALNRPNALVRICGFVLLLVCVLFAVTQLGDINNKVASYLFITAVSLLNALAWQLSCMADEPRIEGLSHLSAFAAAGAFLTLTALFAVKLWGVGNIVVERTLTPAIYALMLAGLVNGFTVGSLIRLGFYTTNAEAVWLRRISLLCLLVVLTIAARIVIGQAPRISNALKDVEIWESTHQEIIKLRDAGDATLYTKVFPRRNLRHANAIPSRYRDRRLGWSQKIYYGLQFSDEIDENCNCTSDMMALGNTAPLCNQVICLVYGLSEG